MQKKEVTRAVWQQNKFAFYFTLTLKWLKQRKSREALKSFKRAGQPSHCHEEQCPRRCTPGRTLADHILLCRHDVKITPEEREEEEDEEEEVRAGQHVNMSSHLDEIFTISIEISFCWVHNTYIYNFLYPSCCIHTFGGPRSKTVQIRFEYFAFFI